ncbi:HNH endonuclease signature motif containing protein [Priestia megaterium]
MKSPNSFEMEYHDVYYYAQIIKNVLDDPISYFSNLESFLGYEASLDFIFPFPRYSHFHRFIEYILESVFFEEASQIEVQIYKNNYGIGSEAFYKRLPIEVIFLSYSVPFKSFSEWLKNKDISREEMTSSDCADYYSELIGTSQWEIVLERLTEEVFYILFLNRHLLNEFNQMIADSIESIKYIENLDAILVDENLVRFLKKDYKVKRKDIPKWVKRAVFFRDRGHCVFCGTDLTGLVSLMPKENFDHIVPLNLYGMNDISNIQLLCAKCNREKSGNSNKVSKRYEKWF